LSGKDVHASVTSYSFNDGINSYSSGDPNTRFSIFIISTDAAGNIIAGASEVQIQLWQSGSSPHTGGGRMSIFDACSGDCGGQGGDNVGNNFICTSVQVSGGGGGNIDPDTCAGGSGDLSTSAAKVKASSIGTWSIAVPPNVSIGPGFTGAWYDPAQSGHGLFIEVLPNNAILAWWFTFSPDGTQSWFGGVGTYSGNTAVIGQGSVNQTLGGKWIPNFDPTKVTNVAWGTLTFTFTDCNSGRVDFTSTVPGYGNGSMNLTRLTLPAGLTCP
jgi:hypothetical protein